MINPKSKLNVLKVLCFALTAMLLTATQLSFSAPQDDEGSRHICPKEAMRNGVCVSKPDTTSKKTSSSTQNKEPLYKRVAKQVSTAAKCNVRVQQVQKTKTQNVCDVRLTVTAQDLPLKSPKIGLTIWRLREERPGYGGARLLTHPNTSKTGTAYQAERIEGDPLLSYGDLVRLGIESPRNGFVYVFDRELYHDGSLSAPYMIFPTKRLRDGNNQVFANRPIELPSKSDNPFYFEAKRVGFDTTKRLAGEILSIVITDEPIKNLKVGNDVVELFERDMASLEELYAGRAEVFELEHGVGLAYSVVEQEAADHASRLLTHNDPVPQTFYLVEEKGKGGLMVTVALAYRG